MRSPAETRATHRGKETQENLFLAAQFKCTATVAIRIRKQIEKVLKEAKASNISVTIMEDIFHDIIGAPSDEVSDAPIGT